MIFALEGQGLHPSPGKQEAWHEVHRLLPKVIDARRCLSGGTGPGGPYFYFRKIETHRVSGREQTMMIYFGDFRFH